MPQSGRKPKPRRGIVSPDAARRGTQRVPKVPTEFVRARAKSWRRDIVQARIRLADEGLTYSERTELWQVVDCREWCLKLLVQDFSAELERIDREIENELRR